MFALPATHRRRLRTSNALERLNKELKRRTRVALFPSAASCARLMTAVAMEISDEWLTDRTYLNLDENVWHSPNEDERKYRNEVALSPLSPRLHLHAFPSTLRAISKKHLPRGKGRCRYKCKHVDCRAKEKSIQRPRSFISRMLVSKHKPTKYDYTCDCQIPCNFYSSVYISRQS